MDVLVVGAGPAGASAAAAAAGTGISVLLVDRKSEPGSPMQCAEYIPRMFSIDPSTHAYHVQHITRLVTHLPSGRHHSTSFLGTMIDRKQFDAGLVLEAVRRGVGLKLNTRLVGLDKLARRAWLKTDGVTQQIHFEYLIAADGPRSMVAKYLNLPPLAAIASRQITVPRGTLRCGVAHEAHVFLGPAYGGGYAWLFPKGEEIHLGVGMVHGRHSLRRALAEFKIGRCLDNEEQILARTGGVIPVAGLRPQLVNNHILFCGDAGGFCHPVTGAGIASAVLSGRAAGAAVKQHDESALDDYSAEMMHLYADTYHRAVRRRRNLLSDERGDNTYRRGWIAFPEYFEREALHAA